MESASRHTYNLSVLYVEDDDVSRESLVKFLRKRLKSLYVAKNGKEGLDLFKEHVPDLVITDIRMPVMDGLRMSKEIKEVKPDVAIIVTTSYNEIDFLISAIEIGIDKYVVKPVNLRNIDKAVEECARVIFQQREIVDLNARLQEKVQELSEKNVYIDSILRSSKELAIIATDVDYTIMYCNPAVWSILDDTVSKDQQDNLPQILRALSMDEEEFTKAVTLAKQRIEHEFILKRAGKPQTRYIECRLSGIRDNSDELAGFLFIAKDISDKKSAEEQVRASLREKEMLLREIHHRVKNNMQVISSLLRLQSRYIKEPDVLSLFKDSESRIRAMALIHEKLYGSRDMLRIDFNDYISHLAGGLLGTYGINSSKVSLKIEANDVFLAIDTAIPCGLIINELLSNSLKYAFPEALRGEIKVSLYLDADKWYNLVISDDGVGMPDGFDFLKTDTLGLQLVASIVTDQLHGEITLAKNTGTTFRVRFSELKYKDRF